MSFTAPTMPPREHGRAGLWTLGGAAAGACALLVWTLLGEPTALPASPMPAPPASPVVAPPRVVPPSPAAQSAPPVPSFDIVRVGPQGETVLAGRSQPGARIVVADNGRTIAQAQANPRGEWVALPAPLPPGAHDLTLAPLVAGPPVTPKPTPVIVVVPGRGAPSGPLALLAPDKAVPTLLQAPTPAPAAGAALAAPTPRARQAALGLGIVDYDGGGAIRFGGTAPAGSLVRVYVDRALAGEARADAQGGWTLQPAGSVAAGHHQLRVDQLASARGAVAARVALPFERVALPEALVRDGHLVVQPGQSLWRIARSVYGRGIRYTVIYLANRSQIRNPSLIYPGQVFALPAAAASDGSAKPNPAAASASR